MLRSLLAAGAGLAFALSAAADTREDAEYIANALFHDAVIDEMFGAVSDMMVPMMIGEMQRNGVELSESGSRALSAMMMDSIVALGRTSFKEMYADVYEEKVSPESLAAFRAFLETDAGRELSIAQPIIVRESSLRGEQIGFIIATNAMDNIVADIEAGRWPEGTTRSAQQELRELFVE